MRDDQRQPEGARRRQRKRHTRAYARPLTGSAQSGRSAEHVERQRQPDQDHRHGDQHGTLGLLPVHDGGPGASHDYLLPYLLPLARTNRLIFIDERGSGRSEKLDNPSGYTVEAMVGDVEAVREKLGLGKISLLGHSFGGVLAQAYALEHQDHLTHLILASTFHSTRQLNEVFGA